MSNAATRRALPLLTSRNATPKGFVHALLRLPIVLLDLLIDSQQRAEERAAMTELTSHQRRDVGLTAEQLETMARKLRWVR